MQELYQNVREDAEDAGYEITDELFEYLVKYARRKAKVAGKDESYIPYLLPDVIKEHFFREGMNSFAFAVMGFERYIKTQKQEGRKNGRGHTKTMAF